MAQTPIPNMQASVALTQYFPLQGAFPNQGGGGSAGFYLGEIGTFAGFFAPAGATATGQLAAISQNLTLYSLLGITYGGNGTTSFGLPNLAGVTMVGTGQGAGLSPETLGQKSGSESVTINYPQAPPNLLGQSQSIDNHQPSLGITYAIEIQGVFPTQGGGGLTPLNTIGMIKAFAGNFDAAGYAACNGQLLSIAQNQALFSILGTTYGGNGITTFALPDLRGRDIIGASATTPIGAKVGQANVNLANGQAPTEGGGPVTPFDNRQPSLSIQYIIALQGIFPSQGGNQDPLTPFLGQIVAFAGNFVPSGWARCDGTILSISQNTALFSLLGTAHGGNGTTTFSLPDLRDRTVIGTGNGFTLGEIDGENSTTITAAELAVPAPRYGGALVTPGQFDTWLPIDSVQTGGGYQIAWKHGAANEYLVWTTDGNGNWLSQGASLSGTSFALESLEPTFGYDLNGDGTVGVVTTTIEAFGATDLKQVANNYYVYAHGTTNGPQLKMSGVAVTEGQNGAWTPISAEPSGGGYKVVWKNGGANEYLVWTIDGSGNWLSQTAVMSGSSATMKAYETTFQQDLNLNGMVGALQIDEETAGLAAAGSDPFQWSPGDGNGTVEGHAGFDTMLINGANVAENIDILASGGHVLFHRDVANVTVDLNGVEKIDFHALGGTDNIVVGDLGGTGVTNVALDLGGPGGGGDGAADTVTVNATQGDDVFAVSGDADGVFVTALQAQVDILFPEAANDRLVINGLDGSDTIDATNLAADGIQLTMNGGAGNDLLLGSQGDDLIDGGDGNDVAFMAAGNDTFVWNPGDDSDTVEGQAGFDTLQFNGADVAENIDISVNGGRVVLSCNVGDVVMDLNGIESIDFNVRGGADTVVVNDLSGTDVSQININLAAAGGAGDGQVDTIVINATYGDHVVLVADGGSGAITVQGLAATVHITGFEAAHDRIVIDGHILLGADLFG